MGNVGFIDSCITFDVYHSMMKPLIRVLFLFIAPLGAAASPNILLICIDDLRPELGCYGVDYIRTPHIDALASESRVFRRHYVQAPTCGASRYALLTGTYGSPSNNALFSRAKIIANDPTSVSPSMPGWFRSHGYQAVSIGKVSHHPGGWGGSDWDRNDELEMPMSWDRSMMPTGPWLHPRGAMHGLANGEIRGDAKKMAVFQTFDGPDTVYPDGLITEAALQELVRLADEETPFLLAVGIIRPHLPFGSPARYFQDYREASLPPIPHPEKPKGATTWHNSGEFMKYNRWGRDPRTDTDFALEVRRHYAACVSYADAQVGRLLTQLEQLELDDNTIVILWGDHGWHLGEHGVWGKHTLFEESLRSPLIIRPLSISAPGKLTDALIESVDVFPTLCELVDLPKPESLDGASLVPQLNDHTVSGRSAVAYRPKAATIRTDTHRLIAHDDGSMELYDHTSFKKETYNLASSEPQRVSQLLALLKERLPERYKEDR